MKKLFLLIGLCLAGTAWLSAQNIVSGTVTDKKGNPIPGVKVEILGGTESTITELDGTFRLETGSPARKVKVYYAGMQSKTQKVKPDMLIKMSETSWWNEKPDKYHWMLGVQAVFPEEASATPSWGLMLGRVKNWGWYVKGVYSKPQTTMDVEPETFVSEPWLTGEMKNSYCAAVGGVMYRLHCPIYAYLGAGYVDRKVTYELANGEYLKNELFSYSGAALDFGLMIRLKHIALNGGFLMSIVDKEKNDGIRPFSVNAGISIYF